MSNDSASSNQGENPIDVAIAKYMQRNDAGEQIDQHKFIADHPEVADQLREYFQHSAELGEIGTDETIIEGSSFQDSNAGALVIRCPQCKVQLEIVVDSDFADIVCNSCGSHFGLTSDGDETSDPATEKTVGHFELVERLGMGGFGTVWKARDTQLDRAVAVKIPRRGSIDSDECERFFREARAAAQLNHPNIVGVHEVGRDGDTLYIVSDLVQGISLDGWLDRQQPSAREAVELCRKIALAVQHAHEQGVIHRDLKPGNIMIDIAGEPHVTDFGLALRQSADITMTVDGHIWGTPAYMSPEQAAGKGHSADNRSDVYSLGVIMFRLLTGELPFRGNSEVVVYQVQHDDPPSPRKLNNKLAKDLETICLKCLEKEPGKRYETAKLFADELGRYLNDQPILARPITKLARTWRWCKRRPMVAGLSALLVFALMLGTAVSTFFAFQSGRRLADVKIQSQRADERTADAEARFELAMDAIKTYYTGVAEDVHLKKPELAELRGRMLGLARGFLDKLADELDATSDQRQQLIISRAISDLAHLIYKVESPENALPVISRAVDISARLFDQHPENRIFRQQLVMNYANLGRLQTENDQLLAARKSFESGIEIARTLERDHPDFPEYQAYLSDFYSQLSMLKGQSGQRSEELKDMQTALEICQGIAIEHSWVPEYRFSLADRLNSMGLWMCKDGQYDLAESFYKQAIVIAETLVANDPTPTEFNMLAGINHNLGLLKVESEQLSPAQSYFRKVVEIRKQLVAENPNIYEYRKAFAQDYKSLGTALKRRSQTTEAISCYNKAIEIQRELIEQAPKSNTIRMNSLQFELGDLCSLLGDALFDARHWIQSAESYQESVDLLQQLADDDPGNAKYRRILASYLGNLGLLQLIMNRRADSISTYRLAVELGRDLIKRDLADSEDRFLLSRNLNELGVFQCEDNDLTLAEGSLSEALEIQTRLVDEADRNPEYVQGLANTYNNLGQVERKRKNLRGARDYFELALECSKQLVELNLRSNEFVVSLSGNSYNIGTVDLQLKEFASARQRFDVAIENLNAVLERDNNNARARALLSMVSRDRVKAIERLNSKQSQDD